MFGKTKQPSPFRNGLSTLNLQNFHRYIIDTEERREEGHYGAGRNVSDEDALESFQWADEFMQAVQKYFGN